MHTIKVPRRVMGAVAHNFPQYTEAEASADRALRVRRELRGGFGFLRQRWKALFQVEFDVLLYALSDQVKHG